MSASNGSVWRREQSTEIDQREIALPPTWVPRKAASDASFAGRSGLFRTERDRAAASEIAKAIDGARNMVVVASFLFGDPKIEASIERAIANGVRVYLLIASEARLEREPREDSEFDVRVVAEHKALLRRLAGRVLVRSSMSYHAKLVLVDPMQGGRGWLLTANLTSEALERNEEIAVELSPAQVASATELVRWAAWEAADHHLLEPGEFLPVEPLGTVARPTPSGGMIATLGQAGSLQAEFLRVIDAATTDIVVSSFGWDVEHPVVQRLLTRVREGVRVTVLARVRRGPMPALLALRQAGARVLGFKYLHAKAVWTDRNEGAVMSANLEPKGLDEGFELGVAVDGDRAKALHELLADWVEAAAWELQMAPRLGEVSGSASVWFASSLVEFVVGERVEKDMGEFLAASADRIEISPPTVPQVAGLPLPAHEVRVRWMVSAPRLEQGARDLDDASGKKRRKRRVSGPPRYRETSGRIVVAICDPAQLEDACRVVAAGFAQAIVVQERI